MLMLVEHEQGMELSLMTAPGGVSLYVAIGLSVPPRLRLRAEPARETRR